MLIFTDNISTMPSTMETTEYGTALIRVSSSFSMQINRPSAIVVLCHGLGGKAENFVHIAEHLASQIPHVEFIIPTAPTQPLTKNMGTPTPSWYDVVGDDRENETYEGIDESSTRIKDILCNAHNRTGIPYSRMILAGFSQGAALSLFTGIQLEEDMSPLAGILLFSGYLPCAERLSRGNLSSGFDLTSILHLHGELDATVPKELAYESQSKVYIELGAASYTIKTYKELGHSISPEEIGDALEFLQSRLPNNDTDAYTAVPTKPKESKGTSEAAAQSISSKHIIIALLALSGVAIVIIRFVVTSGAKTEGVDVRNLIDPEQIRFNKFSIIDSGSNAYNADPTCNAVLPLGPDDYLISGSKNGPGALCMLMNRSSAVSVVPVDDYETRKIDITELLGAVGGTPSQPSSDESGEYWDRLETVIDVQKVRLKRGSELSRVALPEFPLPYRWVEFTVNDVADAVHDEYPGLHQSNLIADLMSGTYGHIELDTNTIPHRSRVEFLRGVVMLTELNQWAIGRVGPYNFMSKWHVGRARPEEMISVIQSGVLSYVPPHIQKKVNGFPSFARPTDFTAYPEGSPGHPSWPAMHAAASGLSFWLAVVLDITPLQHCQAKLTDYAVAWGRTVAGVHYEDDNLAGLDMGQEVIARLLPEYLANMYGADIAKVEAKVEAMRFSWRDFNSRNPCPGTEWMQWSCKSRLRRCSFRGSATA